MSVNKEIEFTDEDLKAAIEAKIFDRYNNVITTPATVIRYFERWAEMKAKEVAKNVRHKACDIVLMNLVSDEDVYEFDDLKSSINKKIMNIQLDDVKPK